MTIQMLALVAFAAITALSPRMQAESWTNNLVLGPNVPGFSFAGIHDDENLAIASGVIINGSNLSPLAIKVPGTLNMGRESILEVRNRYYSEAPLLAGTNTFYGSWWLTGGHGIIKGGPQKVLLLEKIPPTIVITSPTPGQRWSNAVFTVKVRVADNGPVAGVWYQLNTNDWALAAGVNGGSNWTAGVTLTPGMNVLRAYAVDEAGNQSPTKSVSFRYVVIRPLIVQVVGKGTLSPQYDGKWLELGKPRSMTASAGSGFRFVHWTDCADTVLTNTTTLRFVMASNLCFQACFVDVARPVVAGRTPTDKARLTNAAVTLRGRATDNSGDVTGVYYQLNSDAAWLPATGTTNWTASLTLKPGPNVVRVYAEDATGNRSLTNRVSYSYVVSAPLALEIVGKGKVSPNYDAKWLELGKLYSMKAKPDKGYRLANWTDCATTVVTNHATLRFVVASNLCFRTHFVDVERPVVAVRTPKDKARLTKAAVTVTGRATDNSGDVAGVFYQLNGQESWVAATGTVNWTASLTLKPGPNVVRVYAQDATGNRSLTNRVSYSYGVSTPLGMVPIPAGSFTMGDRLDGDSSALPLHTIQVSAFYMDPYEVTKAWWDEVRVWANANGYDLGSVGFGKATNHPAHEVSWYDVVKWCNARSEWERRVPAYYTSAAQTTVYRRGHVDVQNHWVKWNTGYRLPTEAEWEKAARGGASGQRFPWGHTNTITHSQANYFSCKDYGYDTSSTRGLHPRFNDGVYPYTSPVGYFAPNGYGLYDMAGNVFEWCWDWYGGYGSAAQNDPRGPTTGSSRVVRGGGWDGYAAGCRTAGRIDFWPVGRGGYVGFRLVLLPGQP